MKSRLLIIGLLFVISYACKDNTESKMDTSITEEVSLDQPKLKGTWELIGFYNYQDNVVVDSFSNNTISRQIKMYSDTKAIKMVY
jgi:nitrate reductase beta subunit